MNNPQVDEWDERSVNRAAHLKVLGVAFDRSHFRRMVSMGFSSSTDLDESAEPGQPLCAATCAVLASGNAGLIRLPRSRLRCRAS
jgi:hypothetical protein